MARCCSAGSPMISLDDCAILGAVLLGWFACAMIVCWIIYFHTHLIAFARAMSHEADYFRSPEYR